ncbi:hypothetical protein D3C72_2065700 [compost metagenome]
MFLTTAWVMKNVARLRDRYMSYSASSCSVKALGMNMPAEFTIRLISLCLALISLRTKFMPSSVMRFATITDTWPSALSSLRTASALSCLLPVNTTLPPALSTMRAVSRPIPLVPPTTSSFLPLKKSLIAYSSQFRFRK